MALPGQTVFLIRAVSPESDQGGSVNAPPNLEGGAKGVRIRNPLQGQYVQNTSQSRSHYPSKSYEEKKLGFFLYLLDYLYIT